MMPETSMSKIWYQKNRNSSAEKKNTRCCFFKCRELLHSWLVLNDDCHIQ